MVGLPVVAVSYSIAPEARWRQSFGYVNRS